MSVWIVQSRCLHSRSFVRLVSQIWARRLRQSLLRKPDSHRESLYTCNQCWPLQINKQEYSNIIVCTLSIACVCRCTLTRFYECVYVCVCLYVCMYACISRSQILMNISCTNWCFGYVGSKYWSNSKFGCLTVAGQPWLQMHIISVVIVDIKRPDAAGQPFLN